MSLIPPPPSLSLPASIQNQFQPYQDPALAQAQLTDAAKAAAAAAAAKVTEQIEKIRSELEEMMNELTSKYNNASVDVKKDILIQMAVVRETKYAELREIQDEIDSDNTPALERFFGGILKLIKEKIGNILGKVELKTNVTDAQLAAVEAVGLQLTDIKDQAKKGTAVDANTIAGLIGVLSSVANLITPPTIPKNDPTPSPSPSGMAGPEATTELLPNPTEAEEKPGGPGGPEGETKLLPNTTEAKEEPAAEEENQKGGGISRKRSHPKYMNQVSENRNKIFKKELEIISSIRRFHRSHTIRKRNKINSILGLRKSRNNNNRNHGNTKRHMHRHNKHKHKSAKHIKK
jgi:hypothetical protein